MATCKKSMGSIKKKLKDMNVDEFFNDDLDVDLDSASDSSAKSRESDKKPMKAKLKNITKRVETATKTSLKKDKQSTNNKKSNEKKKLKNQEREVVNNTKKSLASTLQENDPEFYDFLKGQDKSLLDNLEDLSQSESDSNYDDDDLDDTTNSKKARKDEIEKELLNMSSGDDSDSDAENNVHKPPEKLEMASDESSEEDLELEDERAQKVESGVLLTHKMVEKWGQELRTKPSLAIFKELVSAFNSAVQEAGGSEESISRKYKIEGGAIFNSVVRLCLTQVVPALQSMLSLPALSDVRNLSDKSIKWKKLKLWIKSYLSSLLDLLTRMSDEAMVNAILKHVHKLIIFYASFPKLNKLLLKKMIQIWTTGEEATRVLAFLCINKVTHLKQDILLEPCLKQMYMAYVTNCKFTSPTTLPHINFMQKSLVEIFTIDQTVGYQYAFVYIRQLAIHLRNAIAVKKKNTCQAVYNWQYVHCLGLWVQLLTKMYPSEVFQPLVYPLTQIIIGTIKLLPTARFYPLRFHCVQFLNKLAFKTNTFIPTAPFLLEIFEQIDFNKRHKAISMKPFNFAVILKFSKAQLNEKAFKDGIIDQLYEHLLESFNTYAHSVSFPELIVPAVVQMKLFLKKCKIANYCKQIKQIVDKIQEQAKFITEKRRHSNIRLDDQHSVEHWENQIAESGTPLRKFYTSWRKLRDRELQHNVSNKDAISGAAIDIPTIERRVRQTATAEERKDFSKLFENNSDSDDDDERFLLKEERSGNAPASNKRKHESDSDEYSDFDDDDLEQLAQSASSDESEVEYDDGLEVNNVKENKSDNKAGKKKGQITTQNGSISPKKNNAKLVSQDVGDDDVVEDFNLSDFD
ncbi:nucleolar complex protein 2 [Biomphalaria glabrata]|uniref:Nucleolar complex protein 2 homolog n=1 Tax=Biomphalaria glabrata TaxID=6526 RepID=A0A9U8DV26_BIOGL|nr:nucleolar complex protein 2 homolog [Biomphalaria glabrata]